MAAQSEYAAKLNEVLDSLKTEGETIAEEFEEFIGDAPPVKKESKRNTKKNHAMVVNVYGGPGAGKSTCALALTAELKKLGINVEYVNEFAKELVYAKRFNDLKNQEYVTGNQYKRLESVSDGGVDVIVTDSPVLLGQVYGKDTISPVYKKQIRKYYDSFHNFNLKVVRSGSYAQDGRIESESEARLRDEQINEMLEVNRIYHGVYNRDRIDTITKNIVKHLRRENPAALEPGHRQNSDCGTPSAKQENTALTFVMDPEKEYGEILESYSATEPNLNPLAIDDDVSGSCR